MVDVSIIIPTFNRSNSLNTCVSSILLSGLSNIEIIIVNDYKEGDVILDEQNNSPLITIVNNPKKGVASARNFGAQHAKSSDLIFVDDDMILNKEAISAAINFIDNTPSAVYNADWVYEDKLVKRISKTQFGRYLIDNNFTTLQGWNDGLIEWTKNTFLKTDSITSQFFGIKKSDFDAIGRYNEDFPFAGFEDHDISLKLRQHKIRVVIDTSVLIYHNEIDRLEVLSWLKRKERGAETRKVAVAMGFKDLELNYSGSKEIIFKMALKFEPLIFFILKLIPNFKLTDPLYSKFINVLLGAYIYKGYRSSN